MEQLLATKLFIPPTRPKIVPRSRLIKQLNDGLNRRLTLVSAPAGFGKTTLVTEWLDNLWVDTKEENQIEDRIAWLSLDESDNDPVRFLAYFIAALNRVEKAQPQIGEGALSMLQSPQTPPAEAVLTLLINEITSTPCRMLLVLDDYHQIDAKPVHDALCFLLEHMPPRMHLVIATREDPPLPLPRLRARDQVTEIRAADLRFSPYEAAEFLHQVMGLDLSADDVTALETRTEGWIAGLQLAAISMQGCKDHKGFIQSFTGGHRLVLDFLIEEVLSQLSESIQHFLLQTAILSRLTGSLCDAITGQENSQETLEMLDRTHLFIVPLDDERRWYRYHHLFGDLLRQRLRQNHIERIPMLHYRASEWFEQNGFMDEAIEHALRAENFERAAHLIENALETVWVRSEDNKSRRWLEKLPFELVFSKPQLCIFHAWQLYLNGHVDEAELRLHTVEHVLEPLAPRTTELSSDRDVQPLDTDARKLLGRAAALRAVLNYSQGDAKGIIQHARQALNYLPEDDLLWRNSANMSLGDAYGFISLPGSIGWTGVE
jgi:LuxR family maltose regulon positive regulatory protein